MSKSIAGSSNEARPKQQGIYDLLATGLIPEFIIRIGIKRMLAQRLKETKPASAEAEIKQRQEFVKELKSSPIAIETDAANRQHYEVPSEFYKLVLGPRLKYSCCYWTAEVQNLAQAEEKMLELSCRRADIKDGQKILDLGCGWGALSLWLAEKYPNSIITAVSNSSTQAKSINASIAEKGLKNLSVITANVAQFETEEKFDRIMSVEMFEHMKNYQALMEKISTWLKPQGKLFVHIFTHPNREYHYEDKDGSDWLTRYFFTGGTMPSDSLLLYFQDQLSIEEHWRVNGVHYQKTAEEWLNNMDKNKSLIMPILKQTYGDGEEKRWWMYWRLFFMACAELWGYQNGEEWMVSHYTFKKR